MKGHIVPIDRENDHALLHRPVTRLDDDQGGRRRPERSAAASRTAVELRHGGGDRQTGGAGQRPLPPLPPGVGDTGLERRSRRLPRPCWSATSGRPSTSSSPDLEATGQRSLATARFGDATGRGGEALTRSSAARTAEAPALFAPAPAAPTSSATPPASQYRRIATGVAARRKDAFDGDQRLTGHPRGREPRLST